MSWTTIWNEDGLKINMMDSVSNIELWFPKTDTNLRKVVLFVKHLQTMAECFQIAM